MIQRSQDFGFAIEAGESFRIVGHFERKHLYRDVSLKLGIVGAVDLAHTARTKRCEDLVLAEFVPRSKRHIYGLAKFIRSEAVGMDDGASGGYPLRWTARHFANRFRRKS